MQKYFTLEDDFDKIITENLPSVISIEKIENGWTNFVYNAITPSHEYLFRFPRNDFFAECMQKEIDFNKYIKKYFDTTTLYALYNNGRVFSKHKKIQGENLYQAYDNLNLKEKKRLARDISKFILDIQNLDVSSLKLEPLSSFLTRLGKVDKNFDFDFSIFDLLKENEITNGGVLCHGDLNPGNILVKNGKMATVFDFAFATVSNRYIDLARIIGRMPDDFKPLMISAFETYSTKKVPLDLLDNYIRLWKYVDNYYINYMKENHKDVVVPDAI